MNTLPDPTLKLLDRLVGTWTTESTHPALPGVMPGTVKAQWLDGRRFMFLDARTDHPDVPNATMIIGLMGHDRVDAITHAVPTDSDPSMLRMHYYDSRGVFRVYSVAIDAAAWRWWRDAPGFSQRLTGTFEAGGEVIVGRSQLCEDGLHWKDDLNITYRRQR